MRAVVQRVSRASVRVAGDTVGEIGTGLLVLVGIATGDDETTAARLAGKVARLRIFPDERGRFDRSVVDVEGEVLVVSQFTLIADTEKGNRPSFTDAAEPGLAEVHVAHFADGVRAYGITVAEGLFGAGMTVALVNEGPVTIVLEA
jgi:D-tyrosyl-tRNA(Tyr) deacylase